MSILTELISGGAGGGEPVAQELLDHYILLNGDSEALSVLLATGVTPASFATWLSDPAKEAKFTQLMSAPNGASAVAASTTAMNAVAASSTAMTAVAASSTTMNAVAASGTAMNIVIASSTAMNAVAASTTAMNIVVASTTAMTAVAASSTAMTAVAASSTAMTVMNNSSVVMNIIYNSPLITKITHAKGSTWPTETVLRTGIGLFVRLTTFGTGAGWGEGNAANEFLGFDYTSIHYSERAANPYNHTSLTASPRLPMRRFANNITQKGYAAVEIAFIPLNN